MNKKKLIILSLILFIILTSVVIYIIKIQTVDGNKNINKWNIILNDDLDYTEKETKEEIFIDKKDKINDLRKKMALKWLILKWDISLQKWDYTSALVKYKQINKEIPNDKSIILKLWDINYILKKFDNAYMYYSQIKDYDKIDKNKIAKTLIFSSGLNNEKINYINNELLTLWLDKEELFYYKTSLICVMDFGQCRKDFHDYFDIVKKQENNTWTWENQTEIKFKDLIKLQKAIENYENFQLDDLNYKWALMAWAFFENWLYPIAIETSKNILKEKNDYKPLIKIIAKSYYELWDYIQAKLYLIEYSNLVKNDKEISFFLWVVYEKLNEYILSTIHFNNAIKNWYGDTLDLYKRIIYNYYELGDIDKMLETFKLIIKEHKDKLTINDYNLAIYYNIINNKIKDAKEYTNEAIKKYPETEIFNWYMWWILMDEINRKINKKSINSIFSNNDNENNKKILVNNYIEAEKYIDKWLEINDKNPMLNFIKWKLEVNKWEPKKAFLFFVKTNSLDSNWDFWQMAREEIKNMENKN